MTELGHLEILSGVGETAATCLVQVRPKRTDGTRVDRVLTVRLSSEGGFEPLCVNPGDATLIARGADGKTFAASVYGDLGLVDAGGRVDLARIAVCEEYGMIRCIRVVGRDLLAAGMAHQVHKYDLERNEWKLIHVDDPKARAERRAAGFNGIDGRDASHWVAVGFSGAIAEKSGNDFGFVTSPTNLVIWDVCHSDQFGWIACGQRGEILVRGGETATWEEINFPDLKDDLFAIKPFRKRLFILGRNRVWAWGGGESPPTALGVACPSREFLGLDATSDALWLFSARSAFVSTDGAAWVTAASLPI